MIGRAWNGYSPDGRRLLYKGGDGGAEDLRAQERARQAKVQAAVDAINGKFGIAPSSVTAVPAPTRAQFTSAATPETPMQWVEVAQAEEIEKLRPRILNQVDRVAEAPELMALGTANGPIRLGPRSLAVAAASMIARVDGPPEPTIRPVMSLETSSGSRPESAMACSMAMWP